MDYIWILCVCVCVCVSIIDFWCLATMTGLTGLITLLSEGSQESSPASQFEDINSLALCLLYSPALTTVHDYWKIHSLDYMDLFWQTKVYAFQYTCLGLSQLSWQKAIVL